MSSKADALKHSEECAYLEYRITALRFVLHQIAATHAKPYSHIAAQGLIDDQERIRKWEHSGLNEQPD